MKIIKELIDKGFKPFRKIDNKYKPCNNPYFFSSVDGGKLCVFLKRGDKEIILGLYEAGFPPTLMHPLLGWSNHDIESSLKNKTVEDIIKLA